MFDVKKFAILTCVMLVSACASNAPNTQKAPTEQQEPKESTGTDSPMPRLWMSHYAENPNDPAMKGTTPIVVVEAVPAGTPDWMETFAGCPSIMRACPPVRSKSDTWTIRLYASAYAAKYGMGERPVCTVEGAASWQGTHVCGRRGLNVLTISERGDTIALDAQGDLGWDRLRYSDRTFVPADPIQVAFNVLEKSENSSPETGHLGPLVKGVEAAARRTEFNADGVRSVLKKLGVDVASIPLSTAIEIRDAVHGARLDALQLPPADRAQMLEAIVARQVGKPTGDPFEPGAEAFEQNGIMIDVLKPGSGDEMPAGAIMQLSFRSYTLDKLPIDAIGKAHPFRWDELADGIQQALVGMRRGERRRAFLPDGLSPDAGPEGTVVYDFELQDWATPPMAPPSLKAPAGAKTTQSGVPYVILEDGTGEPPTGNDQVAFYYFAWTPDGELYDLYSYWRPMRAALDNRMITADKWFHEALSALRPGSRAVFYVPASAQQPGVDGEPPRDLLYVIRTVAP